ncbi:MAG TPA: tetratricopeptide repeat protein [Allosphingosinicella sp.]|nr:tetratricopeptide repeat protein [Allosphingosinicella sp.]
MPIIAAIVLLQIACAVHCVRSGRSGLWIMIIVFFPVLGSLAYVIMEVWPQYAAGRTVRKVKSAAAKAIDPERELRVARMALETADTAASRTAFADALAERRMWVEAIGHYEAGEAKAPGGSDRAIRLKRARACFEAGRFKAARALLDSLPPSAVRSDNDRANLLLARLLEEAGETGRALALYADVGERLPGAEAQCRQAALLIAEGREGEALGPLTEAEKRAERMDRHELAREAEMYAWAAETLAELRAEGGQAGG